MLDEILNRAPRPPRALRRRVARSRPRRASTPARSSRTPRPTSTCRPRASATRRSSWSRPGRPVELLAALERLGLAHRQGRPARRQLLDEVKAREAAGLRLRRARRRPSSSSRAACSADVPRYFEVDSFRVMVERRHNALGELVTVSEAIVKVTSRRRRAVDDRSGEGNGPVNALDNALRKDARGAATRQTLARTSSSSTIGAHPSGVRAASERRHGPDDRRDDGHRRRDPRAGRERDTTTDERWFTVGVSPNIVDASFEALIDSRSPTS